MLIKIQHTTIDITHKLEPTAKRALPQHLSLLRIEKPVIVQPYILILAQKVVTVQ